MMRPRSFSRVHLTIACLTASLVLGAAPGILAQEDPERLTYLASRLSEEQLAELAEIAPNVRIVTGLDEQERLARAGEFDGVDAHLLSDEFLAAAERLRWVQAWSAGVDRYMGLTRLVENDQIVMTNMKGVHGPAIAEHTFAMLLFMTRDLGAFREMQKSSSWNRGASDRMTALAGRTMLVVGMGGIGSEIARRAHGFDMRVLATVRTKRDAPEYVDELGNNSDLDRFLGEADVVIVALPLTEETRGLFDKRRLSRLKKGAWFINIGRGKIVDTGALLEVLESGQLAGAGLDVTDPEPLPEDHPLWSRDDVIITPHVSARAEITGERRWEVIRENMRRFSAGEELINAVNKRLGY
jgi:phosphoglycerate dehydrogenase-like enzyme